jgi:hypothetical protein
MHKSSEIEHPLNPSATILAISGELMTLTEKGNSTVDSVDETPGEKVNHRHNDVDTGSNGSNVNQYKQTRVEVDSNSADQLLWRGPQCSYTNERKKPGLCLEIWMNGHEYVLFLILVVLVK